MFTRLKQYIRRRYHTLIFKHLFGVFIKNDIIHISKGQYFINRNKLNPEQVRTLSAQSKALLNSDTLKIVFKEIRGITYDRMFHKGVTSDDLIGNKMVLFTLTEIEKILKELSRMK